MPHVSTVLVLYIEFRVGELFCFLPHSSPFVTRPRVCPRSLHPKLGRLNGFPAPKHTLWPILNVPACCLLHKRYKCM